MDCLFVCVVYAGVGLWCCLGWWLIIVIWVIVAYFDWFSRFDGIWF